LVNTGVSKDTSAYRVQGEAVQEDWLRLLECMTIKLKSLLFFETSVNIYDLTWRNVPECLNLQYATSL
jgi:hypothetical protein